VVGSNGQNEEEGTFGEFYCNENEGLEYYSFIDRVTERIKSLGVNAPPKPRFESEHLSIYANAQVGQYFDGRLPTVIRKLSLDQLSALYSLFSGWFAYLAFVSEMVAAERSETMRKKEFLWSHVRSAHKKMGERGKKVNDQEASDRARIDARFIRASAAYEEVNAVYDIIQAMWKVADQDMKVISREVTIHQEQIRKKMLGQGFIGRGRDDFSDMGGDVYHGSAASSPPKGGQNTGPARPSTVRSIPRHIGR
jgi:hypothetical protein